VKIAGRTRIAQIRDLEQFRHFRPVWDRAAEMILIAGQSDKRADIAEAARQMLVALDNENWWSEIPAPKGVK